MCDATPGDASCHMFAVTDAIVLRESSNALNELDFVFFHKRYKMCPLPSKSVILRDHNEAVNHDGGGLPCLEDCKLHVTCACACPTTQLAHTGNRPPSLV